MDLRSCCFSVFIKMSIIDISIDFIKTAGSWLLITTPYETF